jgi:DnaA family protein
MPAPASPEFDERWAAVLMDDVHLYTPLQQARAFNWFVNATSPPPARRAGCWPQAMRRRPICLREDLRSRLGWGHVFQLHLLDESARRAVLSGGRNAACF